MKYDIIVKDPVTSEKILVSVPFEVVSVQRTDGIRFISVSLNGGAFNLDGTPFVAPYVEEY